jgi:hypothetical protein
MNEEMSKQLEDEKRMQMNMKLQRMNETKEEYNKMQQRPSIHRNRKLEDVGSFKIGSDNREIKRKNYYESNDKLVINPTRENIPVSRGRQDNDNIYQQQRGRSQGHFSSYNIINHSDSGKETNNREINNNRNTNNNQKTLNNQHNNEYMNKNSNLNNNDNYSKKQSNIADNYDYENYNPNVQNNIEKTKIDNNNQKSEEEEYREYIMSLSPEERDELYKRMMENYEVNQEEYNQFMNKQQEVNNVPETKNNYEQISNRENINSNINKYEPSKEDEVKFNSFII